jgi:hypothetical protein
MRQERKSLNHHVYALNPEWFSYFFWWSVDRFETKYWTDFYDILQICFRYHIIPLLGCRKQSDFRPTMCTWCLSGGSEFGQRGVPNGSKNRRPSLRYIFIAVTTRLWHQVAASLAETAVHHHVVHIEQSPWMAFEVHLAKHSFFVLTPRLRNIENGSFISWIFLETILHLHDSHCFFVPISPKQELLRHLCLRQQFFILQF